MIIINEYFRVSDDGKYKLIDSATCLITKGILWVVKEGGTGRALGQNVIVVALKKDTTAIAHVENSIAEATAANSVAKAWTKGAIAKAFVADSIAEARRAGAIAEAHSARAIAKAFVKNAIARAYDKDAKAESCVAGAIAEGYCRGSIIVGNMDSILNNCSEDKEFKDNFTLDFNDFQEIQNKIRRIEMKPKKLLKLLDTLVCVHEYGYE
jgi:hypothetical protein